MRQSRAWVGCVSSQTKGALQGLDLDISMTKHSLEKQKCFHGKTNASKLRPGIRIDEETTLFKIPKWKRHGDHRVNAWKKWTTRLLCREKNHHWAPKRNQGQTARRESTVNESNMGEPCPSTSGNRLTETEKPRCEKNSEGLRKANGSYILEKKKITYDTRQ